LPSAFKQPQHLSISAGGKTNPNLSISASLREAKQTPTSASQHLCGRQNKSKPQHLSISAGGKTNPNLSISASLREVKQTPTSASQHLCGR